MAQHVFPPGPLLAELPDSAALAAALIGVTTRTIARWRSGDTVIRDAWLADRYAVAAGLHPICVWPVEWSAAVADPDPLPGGPAKLGPVSPEDRIAAQILGRWFETLAAASPEEDEAAA